MNTMIIYANRPDIEQWLEEAHQLDEIGDVLAMLDPTSYQELTAIAEDLVGQELTAIAEQRTDAQIEAMTIYHPNYAAILRERFEERHGIAA